MVIRYDGAGSNPATGPTPGITMLQNYLLKRYGGTNLGVYAVRNIRGGGTLSLHAAGRACDWGYPDLRTADVVINFLIDNFGPLGVQGIHDYERSRIWRCNRPEGPSWLAQPQDQYGMGQPWAHWLHIEVNISGGVDTRNIEQRINMTTGPDVPPPRPQEDFPVPFPRTIHDGDQNTDVSRMQGLLNANLGGRDLAIDGYAGPVTINYLTVFQASRNIKADGICGPQTWRELFEDG